MRLSAIIVNLDNGCVLEGVEHYEVLMSIGWSFIDDSLVFYSVFDYGIVYDTYFNSNGRVSEKEALKLGNKLVLKAFGKVAQLR